MHLLGLSDIFHIGWDVWAKQAAIPEDVAVFVRGTTDDDPSAFSLPDIHECQPLTVPALPPPFVCLVLPTTTRTG